MPVNIGPVKSITRDTLINYINDPHVEVVLYPSNNPETHIWLTSAAEVDTVTPGDKIRVSEGRYGHLYTFQSY